MAFNSYLQSIPQNNFWDIINSSKIMNKNKRHYSEEDFFNCIKQQSCNAAGAPIEMIFPNMETEEKVFVKRTKVKRL